MQRPTDRHDSVSARPTGSIAEEPGTAMLTARSAFWSTAPPSRRRLLLLLAIAAALTAMAGIRWLGAARMEQRLLSASLEELQTFAGQQPDNPRVFQLLGERATREGKALTAMNAYWRAVQLAPDREDVWLGWATATRDAKGPQAADQVLEAYLKRRPHSARALLERAKIYRGMEYHREAFRYAREAVGIEAGLVDAWGIMAEQAREFRDYATAEDAAHHALALAPRDWRCHLEMGRALLAERRTDSALLSLRRAAELAPERAATHLHLGIGLLAGAKAPSDFQAARSSLLSAAGLQKQLGPHDRFSLALAVGQSYQREADWKSALGPLLDAVKIEPGDETIHYALAQVYQGLGNKTRAATEIRIHTDIAQYHASIRYLLFQISSAPENPAPRLKLARLYASRGDTIDAAKTYRAMLSKGLAAETAEREMHALEAQVAAAPK